MKRIFLSRTKVTEALILLTCSRCGFKTPDLYSLRLETEPPSEDTLCPRCLLDELFSKKLYVKEEKR